jgi:hypothetical protein
MQLMHDEIVKTIREVSLKVGVRKSLGDFESIEKFKWNFVICHCLRA